MYKRSIGIERKEEEEVTQSKTEEEEEMPDNRGHTN
jgi:hypothetical protein